MGVFPLAITTTGFTSAAALGERRREGRGITRCCVQLQHMSQKKCKGSLIWVPKSLLPQMYSQLLHTKEILAFKGSASLVSRQEQIITFTCIQAEIMLGITQSECYSEFHYYHGTCLLWQRHQEIHLLPFGHHCDPKQQPSLWFACSPMEQKRHAHCALLYFHYTV